MMQTPIAGKRILFFAPKFFNYENEIADAMRRMGAQVDLFDERPGNGFFTKALIRINRKFLAVKIASYFRKILRKTKTRDYDFIVFIKGEAVSLDILRQMKSLHRNAKFILYFWDSLKNNRNGRAIMSFFDRVLSFDHVDCAREKTLVHRPLFYLDVYRSCRAIQKRDIDLLFIGTVHSDRFALARRINALCRAAGVHTWFAFFFQSPPLFVVRRLFDKSFRGTRVSDFFFRALSRDDVVSRVARSTAVLDIQHPRQTGLTMRTIEVLGAGRKLVTTNEGVRQYDFYNADDIMIIDRDNPVIDLEFFKRPFSAYSDDVYKKYSIEQWITDLLDIHCI
jgi:hypothetical protein